MESLTPHRIAEGLAIDLEAVADLGAADRVGSHQLAPGDLEVHVARPVEQEGVAQAGHLREARGRSRPVRQARLGDVRLEDGVAVRARAGPDGQVKARVGRVVHVRPARPLAGISNLCADGVSARAERDAGAEPDRPPRPRNAGDDGLAQVGVPLRDAIDDEPVGTHPDPEGGRALVPVQADLGLDRGRQVEGRGQPGDVGPRRGLPRGRVDGLRVPDLVRRVGRDEEPRPGVRAPGVAIQRAVAVVVEVVEVVARDRLDGVGSGTQQDAMLHLEGRMRLRGAILEQDAQPPLRVAHLAPVDLEREAGVTLPVATAGEALGADPAGLDPPGLLERERERQARLAPPAREDPVGTLALRGPLDTRRGRTLAAVVGAAVARLLPAAVAVAADVAVGHAARGVLVAVADAVSAHGAAVLDAGG